MTSVTDVERARVAASDENVVDTEEEPAMETESAKPTFETEESETEETEAEETGEHELDAPATVEVAAGDAESEAPDGRITAI